MTGIRVSQRDVLTIPECWTCWVHDGQLYKRTTSGHVYRAKRRMFSEPPRKPLALAVSSTDSQSLSLHV